MDEMIEINFEEEVDFISKETGSDADMIEKILLADSKFLESKGLIVDCDKEE